MKIIYRLIFVVFIIPLAILYITFVLLALVFYIPYWIITGESLIEVADNFYDWLWNKIALNG